MVRSTIWTVGAIVTSGIGAEAEFAVNTGMNIVYVSRNADGVVQYVGITNDFARRVRIIKVPRI